jgi:hypothetical protein
MEKLSYTDWDFLIDALIGDKTALDSPFERELLLYQLQTWIYMPDEYPIPQGAKKYVVVNDTGIVAAAKFLERLGRKYLEVKGPLRYSTVRLAKCLMNKAYMSLYNTVLKPHGGWTCLLHAASTASIDKMLNDRRKNAETVCEIMDYRFRFLDHGGADRRQANISHGQYFRYMNNKHPLSGKTIRQRWSANKKSAIFLYVSERFGPSFFPPKIDSDSFVDEVVERASNLTEIRCFFSKYAYVAEVLRDSTEGAVPIPESLKPIRPATQPLSDNEKARMLNYKIRVGAMRDS